VTGLPDSRGALPDSRRARPDSPGALGGSAEARPPEALPGPGDAATEEAARLLGDRCPLVPEVAVVTGSGLEDAVLPDLRAEHEAPYDALPGFPPPSVPGHPGRLVLGELHGVRSAVFLGRVHFYEGHGIAATTLIPRLARALGARVLVLTNAAGGLRPGLRAGQLLVLEDHLNFLGVNPLAGWRAPGGGPAFVDLARVYDRDLIRLAERAAREAGVDLARGVYAAVPGPSYETPAERRFLAMAGADAVGMSTVPEAVAGVALGMRVVALSCITNVPGEPTSHQEVLRVAREGSRALRRVLAALVPAAAGASAA
jgi:purine-nucleoside phosphorylase